MESKRYEYLKIIITIISDVMKKLVTKSMIFLFVMISYTELFTSDSFSLDARLSSIGGQSMTNVAVVSAENPMTIKIL